MKQLLQIREFDNRSLIFNKIFGIKIHFWLWHGQKKITQTEIRCVIGKFESRKLNIIKSASSIYTKYIIIIEISKTGNSSSIKWRISPTLLCCYLLPWEICGSTKCYSLLQVEKIHRSRIKFLIGSFTEVPILNCK